MQAAGSEDYADMDYIYTLYLFNTARRSLPVSLSDIYVCASAGVPVCLYMYTHDRRPCDCECDYIGKSC